jgi:hypothetical protein
LSSANATAAAKRASSPFQPLNWRANHPTTWGLDRITAMVAPDARKRFQCTNKAIEFRPPERCLTVRYSDAK